MTGGVVALVPAKDSADSITATVKSLVATGRVDKVIVVDDGSGDDTSERATRAGADVVRLEQNCGKGAALAVGVASAPTAATYLLVDADTGSSASLVVDLLVPLDAGEADLVIGRLPSAGGRGGFGAVKGLAARLIEEACGFRAEAPLSGQRAIRGSVLRALTMAPRFGVEVAMTIDAVRLGCRVVERPVAMDHDHRGKSLRGFLHRGRQGIDVLAVAIPRLVAPSVRMAAAGLAAVFLVGFAVMADTPRPPALALRSPVTVQVVPGATWEDVRFLQPNYAASLALNARDQPISGDLATTTLTPNASALEKGSVIVVGVGPPGDKVLRPVLVFNADGSGLLGAIDTRRAGLVTAGSIPSDLRAYSGADPLSARQSAETVEFYDRLQPIFISVLVAVLTAYYLYALLAGRRGQRAFGADRAAQIVASVPLAAFAVRGLGAWPTTSVWLWSALTVGVIGIISVMAGRPGGAMTRGQTTLDRGGPLRRILLATVVVMLFDLATGSHLLISGIFGSSPSLGSRFYGIGNPAAVILLTSMVLWAGLHVRASIVRRAALVEAAAVATVTTALVAAPGLGADTGGVIAFGFTSILLIAALVRRHLSIKPMAMAVVAAVTALLVLVVVDLLRPTAAQSHLGRLMSEVSAGDWSVLGAAIGRRAEANFLSYGFPWTLLVVTAAVTLAILLWRSRHWSDVLPVDSDGRIAVAVALTGALVLFAVNDSGVVVVALTALTIGPLLLVEYNSKFLVSPISEVQTR